MESTMAHESLYTIGELAELAGVTPRTIRYYTAEGLLPRPDARGQYALYGQEHLLRLQLIARLKAAYLPLGEIKARIEHLDPDQIRQLLEEYRDLPAGDPSTSAADYLSQLLATQAAPQPSYRQTAERSEHYSTPQMRAFAMRQPSSEEPLSPPAPSNVPAYGFASPASLVPPAAAPAPTQPGLLHKLIPQRRTRATTETQATESPAEESWRRVVLAPGVELHVREPAAPALHERIEQLIALARGLFEAGD
jgi:DNA-binding transcriptional MerR regulator